MVIPNSGRSVSITAPLCVTFARSGGNVGRFLLQRNIKIEGAVTFSQRRSARYNVREEEQ